MKVALYARVSTKKQDLDSMRHNLIQWALQNYHEFTIYEDFAISGRKTDREGINRLMEDAREHKFEAVAVIELSRIGRSIGFITSTVKELAELKIPIILTGTNMTLNYDTIEGSATVNALAMAADIEWRLISERNKRGREKIKREGIKVGRKHKKISDDAIKALHEKGYSLRMIAKELGVSAPTIMRRMKRDE